MAPVEEVDAGRKRRAHTKSRRGCGNCKLRRVKCDETRPECKKCHSYGVACNYGGGGDAANELQHSGEAAFIIENTVPVPGEATMRMDDPPMPNIMPPAPLSGTVTTSSSAGYSRSPPTAQRNDLNAAVEVEHSAAGPRTPPSEALLNLLGHKLALHDTSEKYTITEIDIMRLQRFHERTLMTIGTAQTVHIYRDSMLQLGYGHSYLTHVVLTMVLMHDRYLSEDPWRLPSAEETFHHYHGTAMFNKMLSQPLEHHEKDAMWGAAALLGAITIAAVDARVPEESWPLKPAGENDLDWLRMSDGKKEVWRLANPMREDSIWRPAMSHDFEKDPTPHVRRPELEALLPYFIRLFDYDDTAQSDSSPYHTAASIIIRLLPIPCTHSTILYFLSFIGHMDPAFKHLLHQKDDRAMMLLAWWYAKMIEYPAWWLQRRARLECKAICIYIGRRYMQQTDVGRLLDFPKMMSGLAISSEFERQVERARMLGAS